MAIKSLKGIGKAGEKIKKFPNVAFVRLRFLVGDYGKKISILFYEYWIESLSCWEMAVITENENIFILFGSSCFCGEGQTSEYL